MTLPKGLRTFNKRYLNRLMGKLAYCPHGPFCVIYHVGRRSGKAYQTPIIAYPDDGSFIIALTYGPEVDWYRNISTAGRCKLLWHRREFAIEKIEPVEIETALPHFPLPARLVLRTIGIRYFVRMKVDTAQSA